MFLGRKGIHNFQKTIRPLVDGIIFLPAYGEESKVIWERKWRCRKPADNYLLFCAPVFIEEVGESTNCVNIFVARKDEDFNGIILPMNVFVI